MCFINRVPADSLHFALWSFPLSQGSWQETFLSELFSALLKLVTDWSLVLSEKRLSTEDRISFLFFVFLFFFLFLLHLYSIDICNGWKINVSDVPVNVNKIKPILKGTWWHVLTGVTTDYKVWWGWNKMSIHSLNLMIRVGVLIIMMIGRGYCIYRNWPPAKSVNK